MAFIVGFFGTLTVMAIALFAGTLYGYVRGLRDRCKIQRLDLPHDHKPKTL